MNQSSRFALLFVTVLAITAGCSKTKVFNVELNRAEDRALEAETVRVHIVGVSEATKPEWEAKKPADYWQPRDELCGAVTAAGLVKELQFEPDGPSSLTLAADDPMWSTWKEQNCMWLVVIADLAYVQEGVDADSSKWMLIMPLAKERWDSNIEDIVIKILPGRLFPTVSWN